MTQVLKLIETSFAQGRIKYPNIYRAWIAASQSIGAVLPNSLLSVSVQKAGELDMLLRCMEDEAAEKYSKPDAFTGLDFSDHYKHFLSELWIGYVYEFIRVVIERTKPQTSPFSQVAHYLRMLRIPMEKHEIAADNKLKEPLEMQRSPRLSDKNDERDRYVYSKEDPLHAHIMPAGASERGSVMWHVIDLGIEKSYWVERRRLADQILEVCKTFTPTT